MTRELVIQLECAHSSKRRNIHLKCIRRHLGTIKFSKIMETPKTHIQPPEAAATPSKLFWAFAYGALYLYNACILSHIRNIINYAKSYTFQYVLPCITAMRLNVDMLKITSSAYRVYIKSVRRAYQRFFGRFRFCLVVVAVVID